MWDHILGQKIIYCGFAYGIKGQISRLLSLKIEINIKTILMKNTKPVVLRRTCIGTRILTIYQIGNQLETHHSEFSICS